MCMMTDGLLLVTPSYRYDPSDETWSPIANMFRARLGLGVACLNRLLYAVGGFDGAERLECVECFDPDTNEWKNVASMHCKRSGAGALTIAGHRSLTGTTTQTGICMCQLKNHSIHMSTGMPQQESLFSLCLPACFPAFNREIMPMHLAPKQSLKNSSLMVWDK